jgi:hypothetical protein
MQLAISKNWTLNVSLQQQSETIQPAGPAPEVPRTQAMKRSPEYEKVASLGWWYVLNGHLNIK